MPPVVRAAAVAALLIAAAVGLGLQFGSNARPLPDGAIGEVQVLDLAVLFEAFTASQTGLNECVAGLQDAGGFDPCLCSREFGVIHWTSSVLLREASRSAEDVESVEEGILESVAGVHADAGRLVERCADLARAR